MYVFELVGENEADPNYQQLAIANLDRQYDFLQSLVQASIGLNRHMVSLAMIEALNFHAIACLHAYAGEQRPCQVFVGSYTPPAHHRVPALMSILVEDINRYIGESDPVSLAAYVLWRMNWIHPFVNGNGRTARVVAYFIICVALGAWLPGSPTLPDLLRRDRPDYVAALQAADASLLAGKLDVSELHNLLQKLLAEQLASSVPPAAGPPAPPVLPPAIP